MSNERIDHAAEAVGLISEANRLLNEFKPMTTEAAHLAAVAQVHATLALVEQQRVANLLALGQYTTAPGDMPVYRSVIFHGDGLRPDITAALGLDAPND